MPRQFWMLGSAVMSLPLQTHSSIYPHPSFFEKSTAIPNSSLLAHSGLGEIEEVFIRCGFPQFLVTFSSFFLRTVSTCKAYPSVCSSDSQFFTSFYFRVPFSFSSFFPFQDFNFPPSFAGLFSSAHMLSVLTAFP